MKDYIAGSSSSEEMTELFGVNAPSSDKAPALSDGADNQDPLIEDALSYFNNCDFDALLSVKDEILG